MNVNSAVERVKNSLSYKLGEAMIAYDKRGGGGVAYLENYIA